MLGNVTYVNPGLGEPPTGEPYAGDPPVRFGGRGRASHPDPYRHSSDSSSSTEVSAANERRGPSTRLVRSTHYTFHLPPRRASGRARFARQGRLRRILMLGPRRSLASLAIGAGMTLARAARLPPTSSRAGLRRSAPWAGGTGPMHSAGHLSFSESATGRRGHRGSHPFVRRTSRSTRGSCSRSGGSSTVAAIP